MEYSKVCQDLDENKKQLQGLIKKSSLGLKFLGDQNSIDIAKQLRELKLVNISPRTVRNRLHEYDLHGRALAKKPLLTKRYIAKRLAFAKKYQNWTVDNWKKVLWLDKTKISLNGSDCRHWTWRRPGKLMQPKHVKQTIKHDKYVMAWGCFSWNGVGRIHVIEDSLTSPKYVRIH